MKTEANFDDHIFTALTRLAEQRESILRALSDAINSQAPKPGEPPNQTVIALVHAARNSHAAFLRELRNIQRKLGLSESDLRHLAEIRDKASLPKLDKRLWRREIEEVDATNDLDELLGSALENLLRQVDRDWLNSQSKDFRLDDTFLREPFHIVQGMVVSDRDKPRPQRFAHMLLLAQDHLKKHVNRDFYAIGKLVPELAVLGNSFGEIDALGSEARRKLRVLPELPPEQVSSTIYELLVGAACVRKGLAARMLPEDRSKRVPDYKIEELGPVPTVVECKRRLGLTEYELREAKLVEKLYQTIRPGLRAREIHGSLRVTFLAPVEKVPPLEFAEDILRHLLQRTRKQPLWGVIEFEELPFRRGITEAPLYSPIYLQEVFSWHELQDEWDGIVCDVEPPSRIQTVLATAPFCLKWRSESKEALLKKSRGITSLWADAIKQIPDGAMGFIYIAYLEGSRPALADARTRYILESMSKVWHRWSVRAPLTIISRIYLRCVGQGFPDLIENALLGTAGGDRFWLKKLPSSIFTHAI